MEIETKERKKVREKKRGRGRPAKPGADTLSLRNTVVFSENERKRIIKEWDVKRMEFLREPGARMLAAEGITEESFSSFVYHAGRDFLLNFEQIREAMRHDHD